MALRCLRSFFCAMMAMIATSKLSIARITSIHRNTSIHVGPSGALSVRPQILSATWSSGMQRCYNLDRSQKMSLPPGRSAVKGRSSARASIARTSGSSASTISMTRHAWMSRYVCVSCRVVAVIVCCTNSTGSRSQQSRLPQYRRRNTKWGL